VDLGASGKIQGSFGGCWESCCVARYRREGGWHGLKEKYLIKIFEIRIFGGDIKGGALG